MDVTDAKSITVGKTNEELIAIVRRPQDWQPAVLNAARLELQSRNLPVPDSPPAVRSNETTSIWSFEGRIPRSEFWAIWFSIMVFSLVIGIVVELLIRYHDEGVGILIDVAFLSIAVWIGLAMQVKRWHDLDRSGWMVLLNLTLIAIPVILIFLGFVRGTVGPNRFGADPLDGPSTAAVNGT